MNRISKQLIKIAQELNIDYNKLSKQIQFNVDDTSIFEFENISNPNATADDYNWYDDIQITCSEIVFDYVENVENANEILKYFIKNIKDFIFQQIFDGNIIDPIKIKYGNIYVDQKNNQIIINDFKLQIKETIAQEIFCVLEDKNLVR